MGYWYDVYVNDDQEPWNRDVYLTKEQAYELANSLYDKGWSVCVVKMVDYDPVKYIYWPQGADKPKGGCRACV